MQTAHRTQRLNTWTNQEVYPRDRNPKVPNRISVGEMKTATESFNSRLNQAEESVNLNTDLLILSSQRRIKKMKKREKVYVSYGTPSSKTISHYECQEKRRKREKL